MDRSAFLAAAGLRRKTVDWCGQTLEIVELSAGQREALMQQQSKGTGPHVLAAISVCMSVPSLTEDDVETILNEVRPDALLSLSNEVLMLSGLADGAADEAKKP